MLLMGMARAWSSGISDEYLADVWTADDGLPSSSVTAIAQTADGYLWIGTYNGIARFDGVRFVVFDGASSPVLAYSRVNQLYADDEGTLWINIFDGSMVSFREGIFTREWKGAGEGLDPRTDLISSSSNRVNFLIGPGFFRSRPQSAPPGSGWTDLTAARLLVDGQCMADGNGIIWGRDSGKHLIRFVGTNFEALPLASGWSKTPVNCLTTNSTGQLCVGTDAGIAVWDGNHFEDATPTNYDSPANVKFLCPAQDGGLWAVVNGTVRKALGRRWILEAGPLKNVFTNNWSQTGAQDDHHGGIWLYRYGRMGQGLWHVADDGKTQMLGSQEDFPGARVNCYFEDREGNMWVGFGTGGLMRIRPQRFQTVDAGGHIPPRSARSVCEDSDGTIWIGTLGDGLERWRSGTLTNFNVSGEMGSAFPFCVCPDATGRLWVSANEENLFVREHDEFRQILPVVHGVKSILADKSGRVWVGTKSGLFFADKELPIHFNLYEGIGRKNIRALAEDGQGNIWAGGDDGIIFRIGTNNATASFHPDDSKTLQPIWSLLAEKNDGTVWIGTVRGGLLRFRDGKFTRFGVNDGLPNDIICQILTDDAGNLWIGSHQGIFRVAKSALNDFARGEIKSIPVAAFGLSDGLPSLECPGGYQPAAWRAHDGRLWFTTLKGAVSIQPEKLSLNLLPPPVVIEEIIVDGKNLDATARTQKNPLPAGIIYNHDEKFLQVSPGKHQFEFRFTGLSLTASSQVQFRYHLDGADASWIDSGTRRSAQYDLLPSGTYKFCVIACNNDRIWNETGDSLTLKILPYFYETLWFRVLAALAAGGLVAGAVWYVVSRRLQRNLEELARQQAVERERTRIAQDIHDDLGANLTLIARLGHLARHEKTGERIEKMESTARQAIKSLDEIVWAVNPRNDTLAHLIDYAGQFANDYLYAADVRCLLDVPEQAPVREVPSNVRHNIFLVIKEALQNIVKHSHATEVWLRINATNLGLRIVIEDNGRGIEPVAPGAQGDGLPNMRQRLNELGGQCLIQRRAGGGTEIIMEMPWPHS
jgi:signal transduction histidine kinase/ligand-binding sensor domain-containing protein